MKPAYYALRDDAVILAALFIVCFAGILLVGQPSTIIDERTKTSRPQPLTISPMSVGVPLRPEIAVSAPRQLGPTELIPTAQSFITLFGEHSVEPWRPADRASPEVGFWRNDFSPAQVWSEVDGLRLEISESPRSAGARYPWSGGEIRSQDRYGYGRYDVVMKPARGSGLVSTFFTYTGRDTGTPHDEIDIEFVGNNTQKVEFNAWRNGKSYGDLVFDLPFDAADDFHLYSFDWHPDGIIWFVDGIPVHTVDATAHRPPGTSAHIFLNLWTGKMNSWHGPPRFQNGTTAHYACVSFRAAGEDGRTCGDLFRSDEPLTAEWLLGQD